MLGWTAGAGGGGVVAAAGALTGGAGAASGFATDVAGAVGALAAPGAAAVDGAAAGGAAADGGADETCAGDAAAGRAGGWGWGGAGLTADRTGCPVDGPADAGGLPGLGAALGCGCSGSATACSWVGGAARDACGSGSLAYFANSALAAAISFPPSIFCSFISLRQASMTGSVALRQRATASGNSVTIKSPRSTTMLATAAAC